MRRRPPRTYTSRYTRPVPYPLSISLSGSISLCLEVYKEDLLDYGEVDDKSFGGCSTAKIGEVVEKGYIGIHGSQFQDLLLEFELRRAFKYRRIEHPSEECRVEASSEGTRSCARASLQGSQITVAFLSAWEIL